MLVKSEPKFKTIDQYLSKPQPSEVEKLKKKMQFAEQRNKKLVQKIHDLKKSVQTLQSKPSKNKTTTPWISRKRPRRIDYNDGLRQTTLDTPHKLNAPLSKITGKNEILNSNYVLKLDFLESKESSTKIIDFLKTQKLPKIKEIWFCNLPTDDPKLSKNIQKFMESSKPSSFKSLVVKNSKNVKNLDTYMPSLQALMAVCTGELMFYRCHLT